MLLKFPSLFFDQSLSVCSSHLSGMFVAPELANFRLGILCGVLSLIHDSFSKSIGVINREGEKKGEKERKEEKESCKNRKTYQVLAPTNSKCICI